MCENTEKGSSHLFESPFLEPFTPVSLLSLSMSATCLSGRAIRLHLWLHAFLNVCMSSPSPTGLLMGTVSVDGLYSHQLSLTGLIGRKQSPHLLLLCTHVREGTPVHLATGSEQLMKNYRFDGPIQGSGYNLEQGEGVKWVCRHNRDEDIVTKG